MDYQKLKSEVLTDPLNRGYSGMSDQEIVDDLNTQYRTQNLTTISSSLLISATNATEYTALTDVKKSQWLSLCAIPNLDPFGPAVNIAINIWGAGSQTISNLQNIRTNNISRAMELFGEVVVIGDIAYAGSI